MAIAWSYEESTEIAIFDLAGTVTVSEVIDALTAFYERVEVPSVIRGLWIVRGNDIQLSSVEMTSVMAFVRRARPDVRGRVGFVATDDANFGMARMSEVHVRDVPIETRVFRDEAAARAWLTEAF